MQRRDSLRLEFARRLDGIKLKNNIVRILQQHDELPRHRLVAGRDDLDRVLSLIQRQRGVAAAVDSVAPHTARLKIASRRCRLDGLRLHRVTRRAVHETDADRLG